MLLKGMRLRDHLSSLSIKIPALALALILLPWLLLSMFMKISFEDAIKDEISDKITGQLQKSHEDIMETIYGLASLSDTMLADEGLKKIYFEGEETLTYYQKMKIFDRFLSNGSVYNLISIPNIRITLFDSEEYIYTNWSLNFKDYSYLKNKAWVRDSLESKAITWSYFSEDFEPGKQYVSLARPILDEAHPEKINALLLLSINSDSFRRLLEPYAFGGRDIVGIYSNQGEGVVALGDKKLDHENARKILTDSAAQKGNLVKTIGGNRYLVRTFPMVSREMSGEEAYTILHLIDFQKVTDALSEVTRKANLLLVVFLPFILGALFLLSYGIVKPIGRLCAKMKAFRPGAAPEGLDLQRKDELGQLNRSFFDMSMQISQLFVSLQEKQKVQEQYRFEALRAQLNPHFLFNTLNTIRWMAMIKKAESIVAGIDSLSGMLQYSMSKTEELVPLRAEIQNIRNYIHIQNLRYGNKLDMLIDLEEGMENRKVIKFILQPIVENAVLHAFKGMDLARILIYGHQEQDSLKLYVEDNGIGMSPESLARLGGSSEKSTGIGINSVQQRIRVSYGEPYGLEFSSHLGGGTTVIYTLPKIEDREEPQ